MNKQILNYRWKDLHGKDDKIAPSLKRRGKGEGEGNREVDHTTGEKSLGEERRLRKNPSHILYFLYEKEDVITFSEAQAMTTYIYIVCMESEDQPNQNQPPGWGEGAECLG